jgi:CBS domain containing-hemolysin-like protein
MPTPDGSLADLIGIVLVLLLVAANGFFVAAEFSLVAVRRSRVTELVSAGRANAKVLQRAVDNLDANLAATQLGITISSLALGWIGEPALAHLIEPLLAGLPSWLATTGSHAIAVAVAFIIITALHIVLGELAPKSLALQRSEGTALAVVRPLGLFRVLLWPAIVSLNGLGNLVLRLFGLRPGTGEETLHSPEELKFSSPPATKALLQEAQQELVERVLNIGDRRISDRDSARRCRMDRRDDSPEGVPEKNCARRHEQLLVAKGSIDEPIGMVVKDLLDQILDGKPVAPSLSYASRSWFMRGHDDLQVLDQFKGAGPSGDDRR